MAISDVDLWYHDLNHERLLNNCKTNPDPYKMKSFIKKHFNKCFWYETLLKNSKQ